MNTFILQTDYFIESHNNTKNIALNQSEEFMSDSKWFCDKIMHVNCKI